MNSVITAEEAIELVSYFTGEHGKTVFKPTDEPPSVWDDREGYWWEPTTSEEAIAILENLRKWNRLVSYRRTAESMEFHDAQGDLDGVMIEL